MLAFRRLAPEWYGALAGEPFLYKPWEIARLTDWQIEELIFGTAIKRNEDMKGKETESFEAPAADRDLTTAPTEEEFVRDFTRQFKGTTPDHWRQVYREQFGSK